MALDYKVTKVNNYYCVEENATGYSIKAFQDQAEAKKYMKFLNLGGGFGGWTPSFILNKSSKNMLST